MKSNGIIVILSYPDTVVRPAQWEFSSKFWPKIGIGSKDAIQAGHAALLLIKKNSSEVNYYDFGRYITSYGNGRVRSKETDPELKIPIKATFKNNKLDNINQLLLWLDKNPEITHGDGRLIASINNAIDFDKAQKYIEALINQKEIPYGAFLKNGTNCARFVTQTIINSCTKKQIILKLKSSYILTPSPIGNAIKGKTEKDIYEVKNQKVTLYKNRSILKEYKLFFSRKPNAGINSIGCELPDTTIFNINDGTWLGGIGSGAWFKIEEQLSENNYKVSRYSYKGEKDFEDIFYTESNAFNLKEKYRFIYPTNCKELFITQNNQTYILKKRQSNLNKYQN
ncbi:MAG: hypothetical protein HWD85_01845 [Flavobacteriaceae bacterium]|nr:hypothetical protein [Flavobacteriaceae bacterium]